MKTIEWQYLIVSYLFLGGLSAGLYFVSALTELFRKDGDLAQEHISRVGALLAPWPVMLGCTLLVFDLGHWYRAYKLFLHFRWESPMSIGSWLLMLFIGISLIYAYGWISRAGREHFFEKLPRRLQFLGVFNVDVAPLRRPLAILGLPVSVGVAIYTGVLLGAVQSRPFWNTNLVAQLFLFSALSAGCALLILVVAIQSRKFEMYEFRSLYLLDVSFLTLEFFIVVPYFIHGELSFEAVRESLKLVLGGPFTILFWVFFMGLGLALPWAIEVSEVLPLLLTHVQIAPHTDTMDAATANLAGLSAPVTPEAAGLVPAKKLHFNRVSAIAAAVLVLIGGGLVRYIFVFAGQISAIR
jgi:formate-dependent nitrite reductase membrane component NrfD